ncbi:MAG: hypothetical protein Q8P68_03185 [Candidatus Peregrinibacteria bacterium]|nr:hypothetical protein [Candidatus Peregrinibacteria bacterium]MDZ4244822.1 hypothetical protein [Candidatus Gracilibacteria bacterium]
MVVDSSDEGHKPSVALTCNKGKNTVSIGGTASGHGVLVLTTISTDQTEFTGFDISPNGTVETASSITQGLPFDSSRPKEKRFAKQIAQKWAKISARALEILKR